MRFMTVAESSPPEIVCVCPRCNRPKLAINTSIKAFHCLRAGCGFSSWDPMHLVRAVRDGTTRDAETEMIAYAMGARIGPLSLLQETPGRTGPLPGGTWPPLGPIDARQEAWLRGRRIPEEHWRWFGLIQALPMGNGLLADWMLPGRVVIPAYVDHKPVFWSARNAGISQGPKTANMPRPCRLLHHPAECTCNHSKWGLPLVQHAALAGEVVLGLNLVTPGHPVIVVEGDIDAVTCGPGFVATYGAHCTEEQALLIARTGASEAIVLFDGDQGGLKGRAKAAESLRKYVQTRIATCPWGEDPGSLGRQGSVEVAMSAPAAGSLAPLRANGRPPTSKIKGRPPLLRKLSGP